MNVSKNYDNITSDFHQSLKQGLLSIVLISLCIATIIGNLLVIVAVLLVPKLQRPENLLIVCLAVADELVGLCIMPQAMVYEIVGYWPFGSIICNLWISLDTVACSASILSLCVISLDRYLVISRPLQYGPKRTLWRMVTAAVLVWVLSFAISIPPLVYFGNQTQDYKCLVSQDPTYQIYATITAFYGPVFLMCFAYGKIYQAAAKISKDERSFTVLQPLRQNSRRRRKSQSVSRRFIRMILPATLRSPIANGHSNVGRPTFGSLHSRELKAFRTLTAIVVVFLVTWLPFFILALIRPFYAGIAPWVFTAALWLGYCNSTINPVLYSIFNKDFRRPFSELLRCRCRSLRKIMRTESYEAQFGTGLTQTRTPKSASPEAVRTQSRATFYVYEGDNVENDL